MRCTEQQLQSWTSPLSQTEEQRAENTIKMIKAAIDANRELSSLDYEVFVQGSFANNTNVRSDSDVDVCVMLKSTFYYDLPRGKTRTDYNFGPGTMEFQRYRDLVKQALQEKFGWQVVTDGNKSLKVRENTYHVQADVVPAFQYRNYAYANSQVSWDYVEGTRFYAKDGREVTNYPKVHVKNGTAKNNRTNYRYKKLVRIMKHVKNEMVDAGRADGNTITSFLVECLVWNTPDSTITAFNTWTETVRETIIYLYNSIKDGKHNEWGEVSEMLYLFRGRKWTDQDALQWLCDAWNYLGY